MKLDLIGWIAMVLVLVGAINWGLVGIFGFDLIAVIFGKLTLISRLLYILIGLSGGWLIFSASKERKR